MISLQNEVVVITGGALRLGRAIALECAQSGASVAITYNRSQNEAQQTLNDLREQSIVQGQKFASFHCDVSQSDQIQKLGEEVLKVVGAPTALINNAAIFRRTPFAGTEYSLWERAFDDHIAANLKGPYLLSKVFGEMFLQNKRGCIVNLADIYGAKPLKNYVPYCLSKAGVIMLTETLAKVLAPHVRVNAICPGTILLPSEGQNNDDDDNQEQLKSRIPMKRLGSPEEIAQAVVFLIGGPQFINGAILPVDGAQRLK